MQLKIKRNSKKQLNHLKIHFKSIRMRITLLVWFLIVLSLSIYILTNFSSQKSMFIDRMRNEAINLAASIDQVTASSVYNEDYSPVVEHCLPLVQKGKSISYIYIVKYDGFALLFTKTTWAVDTLKEKRFIKSDYENDWDEFYFDKRIKKEVFHYAYPFQYAGLNWGWIHIGLSLEKYNRDINTTLWNDFFLALVALFIGFFATAFFARRIVQPIQALDRIARDITAGDLHKRAEIRTGDELESLANSFNQMTDQLQKSRDKLEQRVKERTIELAETNKKLLAEIRARKQTQAEITVSLAEKEVLLKEIHHRVKNNLQIISSLLYLQSKNITDEETISMFTDSRNRVISMALIHENLYRSDNLALIDIREYLQNLTRELNTSYSQEGRMVTVSLDIEPVPLSIDKAIPVGLIVNELISNAYKYAFSENSESGNGTNELQVILNVSEDREVTLSISDNGTGLPGNIDFRESPSLGLQLVNSLVNQLDGEINYIKNGGSKFEIHFVLEDGK